MEMISTKCKYLDYLYYNNDIQSMPIHIDTRYAWSMDFMFALCTKFNNKIHLICTNLRYARFMFKYCIALNSPIILEDMQYIEYMDGCFTDCPMLNKPLIMKIPKQCSDFTLGCYGFNQPLRIGKTYNPNYNHSLKM